MNNQKKYGNDDYSNFFNSKSDKQRELDIQEIAIIIRKELELFENKDVSDEKFQRHINIFIIREMLHRNYIIEFISCASEKYYIVKHTPDSLLIMSSFKILKEDFIELKKKVLLPSTIIYHKIDLSIFFNGEIGLTPLFYISIIPLDMYVYNSIVYLIGGCHEQ